MQPITIIKVILNQDFRAVHKHRTRAQNLLKKHDFGYGVLGLNKSRTRARVYDTAGGIYCLYAPRGSVFDVAEIQRRVAGLMLTLKLSEKQVVAIDEVEQEPLGKAA